MLTQLLRKKTAAKRQPRQEATESSSPLDDRPSADDAYAELPPGNDVRPVQGGTAPTPAPAPAVQRSAATEQLSPADGFDPQAAGEMRDPRALIAEAIGTHAVTLAKQNTILKISTLSLAGLSLILGLAANAGWSREAEYRYFFFSSDGRVVEREPLSSPVLSLNNVRDFYAESLSHLFSFHYRNFADHYQRLAPDIMTEQAMHEFAAELDRIGLLSSMTTRREVAEAVILQTPVLNASGEDPVTGLYTWELTVPFNLRLESGLGENMVRRMGGIARVQIVRVEPYVHPRQIMINRITIRDTANE